MAAALDSRELVAAVCVLAGTTDLAAAAGPVGAARLSLTAGSDRFAVVFGVCVLTGTMGFADVPGADGVSPPFSGEAAVVGCGALTAVTVLGVSVDTSGVFSSGAALDADAFCAVAGFGRAV